MGGRRGGGAVGGVIGNNLDEDLDLILVDNHWSDKIPESLNSRRRFVSCSFSFLAVVVLFISSSTISSTISSKTSSSLLRDVFII